MLQKYEWEVSRSGQGNPPQRTGRCASIATGGLAAVYHPLPPHSPIVLRALTPSEYQPSAGVGGTPKACNGEVYTRPPRRGWRATRGPSPWPEGLDCLRSFSCHHDVRASAQFSLVYTRPPRRGWRAPRGPSPWPEGLACLRSFSCHHDVRASAQFSLGNFPLPRRSRRTHVCRHSLAVPTGVDYPKERVISASPPSLPSYFI